MMQCERILRVKTEVQAWIGGRRKPAAAQT